MPLNIGTAELVEELVELKDLIKKDEDENTEHTIIGKSNHFDQYENCLYW